MQLQCHGSAKKHKKAKNEHKTPQEFPAKEPDKQIIHNGGDRNVTPLFYGGMAYDIAQWVCMRGLADKMVIPR